MKTIITALLSLLFCSFLHSQTIYGVTGLLKTPNAYIAKNGFANVGIVSFKDYFNKGNKLFKQNAAFLNIGFHSRVEIGLRLAQLPDDFITETEDSLVGPKRILDRVLSAKVILFKEKDKCPQIAVGMQDIIGTRLHNSTYVTATKTFQLDSAFSLLLNLGFGSKLNKLLLGDAGAYHFIGFFGGGEIGYKNTLFLRCEYDAKDVNAGIRIAIKDWFNFNFSFLKMQEMAGGVSCNIKL